MEKESSISLGRAVILLALFAQNTACPLIDVGLQQSILGELHGLVVDGYLTNSSLSA